MEWLFGCECRNNVDDNSQRNSSTSVTSLMETKNTFLLIIASIFSLITGIIILFAGIYCIYKKKFLIIQYDIKPEDELVMIPIIFYNILNFLISFSQIYFFISIKNQTNKYFVEFVFSFLNWFYPLIQILIGSLYIIEVISIHSKLFVILKLGNSFLLICMIIIIYNNDSICHTIL